MGTDGQEGYSVGWGCFGLTGLDSLFGRVEGGLVDVAGPHAYWLGGGGGAVTSVTSAMMVVQLSEALWARMEAALERVKLESRVDVYDMDLINQEFFKPGRGWDGGGDGDNGLVLPGEFCTLNSHWEVGEVPAWSRFRQDHIRWPREGWRALGQDRAVRGEQKGKQGRGPSLGSMVVESGAEGHRSRDEEAKRNGTLTHRMGKGDVLRYDPGLVDPLTSIFHNDVYVLHFMALGKPWSFTMQGVHQMRPDAHPLFAEQFLLWRRAAKYVCPPLPLDEKGGNEVVGKKYNYGDEGGEGGDWHAAEAVTERLLDDV